MLISGTIMLKTCTKCGEDKPPSEFNRRAVSQDGRAPHCRTCSLAYLHKWRNENTEHVKAYRKKYHAENKATRLRKIREWRLANPARDSANKKRWKAANRDYCTAAQALRDAARLCAMPRWADDGAIKAIYASAAIRGLTVDHIVPLQSPLVCGLHCEANLQLLPAGENSRKGNRWWPDMP
jgi:hypothetical protein